MTMVLTRQQNWIMKKEAVGLGAMIRDARVRRGMTQDQLARRIGAVGSYVSMVETGVRKWPQELIAPIADALGLDQIDMAIAAGLISPPCDHPMQSTDPMLDELIDKLRRVQLSEERVALLGVILDVWEEKEPAAPRRNGRRPVSS